MINVTWYKSKTNWGDILNPILVEKISGQPVSWVIGNDTSDKVRHYVIGSILQWVPVDNAHVWGVGFMDQDRRLKPRPMIHAVRGPLTRDILLEQGIACPEIYGDPALLYPRYYDPKIKKKYKIGIVPHYIDQDVQWLKNIKSDPNVLIIDILSGVNHVVDQIKSCEMIASSSLHGIIAADAYGIPSVWIELSNKVLGNGFKFRDYFKSVGRTDMLPHCVSANTPMKQVMNKFTDYKIDIDLDKLMSVCPFRK